MFDTDSTPRMACLPMWLVRMAPIPTFISHGSMNISPKTLRASAISKIGNRSVR